MTRATYSTTVIFAQRRSIKFFCLFKLKKTTLNDSFLNCFFFFFINTEDNDVNSISKAFVCFPVTYLFKKKKESLKRIPLSTKDKVRKFKKFLEPSIQTI